jgi:hypothetical protein
MLTLVHVPLTQPLPASGGKCGATAACNRQCLAAAATALSGINRDDATAATSQHRITTACYEPYPRLPYPWSWRSASFVGQAVWLLSRRGGGGGGGGGGRLNAAWPSRPRRSAGPAGQPAPGRGEMLQLMLNHADNTRETGLHW